MKTEEFLYVPAPSVAPGDVNSFLDATEEALLRRTLDAEQQKHPPQILVKNRVKDWERSHTCHVNLFMGAGFAENLQLLKASVAYDNARIPLSRREYVREAGSDVYTGSTFYLLEDRP